MIPPGRSRRKRSRPESLRMVRNLLENRRVLFMVLSRNAPFSVETSNGPEKMRPHVSATPAEIVQDPSTCVEAWRQVGALVDRRLRRLFHSLQPAGLYRRTRRTHMNKTIDNIFFALLFIFALAMSGSVMAQGEGAPKLKLDKDGIALEIVGQVQNVPATPLSNQYGYISAINEIDSVFNSSTHNEGTALFTFYTEAHTDSVINNGKLRIVDRTGTTTIYFDEAPNGNFNDPNT